MHSTAVMSVVEDVNTGATEPFLRHRPLNQLNKIARRPPVDIQFHELSYSVPDTRKGGKILNILNISDQYAIFLCHDTNITTENANEKPIMKVFQ